MPKSITPTCKAKRGDLVVITRHHTAYVIGQDTREYEQTKLGIVRSVTREGMVKTADVPFTTEASLLTKIDTYHTCYIIPRVSIDVESAMTAYRARRCSQSDMVRPFNSVNEAREFLRPFLIAA